MSKSVISRALTALATLMAAGAVYQAAGNYLDARRTPEAGRLVKAGKLRLLLHCTGAGSPAVIFEAGLGDLSNQWRLVQPEISKRSRACSYDRAGYGSSDPGEMPRTSRQIATELHALLASAGEQPPFILVGSSFGGYNVRVYNALYPEEVAGIVLADSVQEDQYALLPDSWKKLSAQLRQRFARQAAWARVFIDLGAARAMMLARNGLNDSSYLILQTKYVRARASELASIEISAEQARAAGSVGDKPLIVLTAGKDTGEVPKFAEFQKVWAGELQMRRARLSRRGEQVMLADSGHYIPSDRPDAIVDAVERIRRVVMMKD